jgi:hypothetical protein
MANKKLTLQEFGLALLAGLASKGVAEIDFSRTPQIFVAFYMAYETVARKVGRNQLDFRVQTPDSFDFKEKVRTIEEQWDSGFTERSRLSHRYRLVMKRNTQSDLMSRTVGGEAVFTQAAEAFMAHYEDTM